MLWNIIYFTIGTGTIAYLHTVPAVRTCVIAVMILIGVLLVCKSRGRIVIVNALCFSLGFTLADYHANHWLINRLAPQWVGKNIVVTGTVVSLPVEEPQYTHFFLRTELFANQGQYKNLQLTWENPHPVLYIGDRWRLTVRLKPPHALSNFGAFNRLRFLWAQDIHATGYVVPKQLSQQLPSNGPRFWLDRWREQLQQQIKQTVQDPTIAAIISALTIGVENGLSDTDWQVLQRTGTVHLVVIAGLHIGFMVLIASVFANRIWRCFPKLLLWFPAQHAAAVAALIFALAYGGLAGFGIPAQRAVIMTVLMTAGQLFYREISAWRRLLLAFWLVIIIQPGALFSSGFWLSFAAVTWIIYSIGSEQPHVVQWRQWLRMQWALFLGLTPLTIYFFQQFSVVSLIANLPAIIWIGWIIVPLCLLAAVLSSLNLSAGAWLFKITAYLLAPLWNFLQWLAALPFAGWRYAFSNPWIMVIALLGAAWCLAPRNIPCRWLGVLGFLPIWIFPPPHPPLGSFWVTMLDVGQGLALTVQTQHHLLVYDTGPHIPDGFDAGRDIVSPYLVTLGAKKIDLLMISHGDNDHSGGAEALLTQWPVTRLLTSIPSLFANHHPEFCTAGQQWQWDGVTFRVLGPPVGSVYKDNNSSCILQIGEPGRQLLLTGDIESPTETELVAQYGANLKSQILVVPHHGSKTSSTENFLQSVHPEYALFSLGYFNRFHFPAPSVVARYQTLGARQWLTAVNGAIILRVSNQSPTITVANPRHYFWQR